MFIGILLFLLFFPGFSDAQDLGPCSSYRACPVPPYHSCPDSEPEGYCSDGFGVYFCAHYPGRALMGYGSCEPSPADSLGASAYEALARSNEILAYVVISAMILFSFLGGLSVGSR